MNVAICPGSFDPITIGHLNVICRASKIFDRVVVCVMRNAGKTSPMFSVEERAEMIKRVVKDYPNVEVDTFGGLLSDYARRFERAVVVKGLRANSDFEYEFQMNMINRNMNPDMETMFIPADGNYTFLSSSIVKEMAMYDADLKGLVPDEIIEDIVKKSKEWRQHNGN